MRTYLDTFLFEALSFVGEVLFMLAMIGLLLSMHGCEPEPSLVGCDEEFVFLATAPDAGGAR